MRDLAADQYVPREGPDDDIEVDLAALWNAVWRFRWGVLSLAAAIALATGFVVTSMQPVYESTATIEIETQDTNLVGIESLYDFAGGQRQYLATQLQILISRDVAERVVRALNLQDHPAFEPQPPRWWAQFDPRQLLPASRQSAPLTMTAEEQIEAKISGLTGELVNGVSVAAVPDSTLAQVTFASIDRRLAATVANTFVEEFVKRDLENRLSGTVRATGWLEERLASLRSELTYSEAALQNFRVREGLVDIGGKTSLGSDELTMLNSRLEQARRARIDAGNIRNETALMGGAAKAAIDDLMGIPAVQNHPLVRAVSVELTAAQRALSETVKTYGIKHPKRIVAMERVDSAQQLLNAEVRKVVTGIEREYKFAVQTEGQLADEWAARRLEMQEFNRKEFELAQLQRDVNTNRELLDVFFTRYKGVNETGGFEQPHARILDRAMVPSAPVRPNKTLAVSLAFVLGAGLGGLIAILLARLDNAIRSPDDIPERLGAPLLGTLPLLELEEGETIVQKLDVAWEKTGSGFSEAVRTIRTGVVLSSLDDPAKIMVVTSSVPGEGKSTLSVNLARGFGQLERTVIIGADMRRPNLGKMMGLEKNTRGVSHFVSGAYPLEDCVTQVAGMGISVVPSGVIPPNPLEMLSSAKFREMLELLKADFDRIIIDSAPVGLVSDALVLASYADSVIYVVKADSTPATVAARNIANIVASNEPLTGVVLNMFDPRSAAKYGNYRYRYGYRYGYGYGGYKRGYANYGSGTYGEYKSQDET